MKICEMCSTSDNNARKGMKKDREQRPVFAAREKRRRDIEDINQFMKTLADICPEYYGDKV